MVVDRDEIEESRHVKCGGKFSTLISDMDLPSTYNGQTLYVVPIATSVTVAGGGEGLLKDLSPAAINGTNMACHYEVEAVLNDHTGSTGATAGPLVKLYRENTADGNAATTASVDETNIDSKQILSTPIMAGWSVLKLKGTFSVAGTYQISGYLVYYTP